MTLSRKLPVSRAGGRAGGMMMMILWVSGGYGRVGRREGGRERDWEERREKVARSGERLRSRV